MNRKLLNDGKDKLRRMLSPEQSNDKNMTPEVCTKIKAWFFFVIN